VKEFENRSLLQMNIFQTRHIYGDIDPQAV